MCWVGRKLLERIPRIAWKNFVIYKVMTTDAKSPSEDYKYIFNKEMPKIKKRLSFIFIKSLFCKLFK